MRVVLDTNIPVSALMVQMGNPAVIYRAWQEGHFTLLTCAEHLDELRATAQCRALNDHPIPPTTFCWPCPKRARPIIW
jgi:predicted nucleic acid-binding protein